MDFVTAITSVTKGFEILKTMQDIDKNFDAASYKAKIAELFVALADAKRDLVDARDEVAAKENEIERLKQTFRRRAEATVVVRGRRYEVRPDGKPMGMPYCDRCETVDGILIRLVRVTGEHNYTAVCPQCKTDFGREQGYMYPEDIRG
jgi:hypothetical protein